VKHPLLALLETAAAPVWPREYTWLFILIGILVGFNIVVKQWVRDKKRKKRRTYYRDTYLNSDDWKRKRALILKRDNYRCVYCGARATQVHHKQYAPQNIGREPIEWLVSVCKSCHERQHGRG
jgi:5-methylcytosine-specific restriction endonuclease McrA